MKVSVLEKRYHTSLKIFCKRCFLENFGVEWKLYPVKTPNYLFETTEIILSVDLEYVVKSLLVRDLKSISELEKLWNEKRDTAG